MGSFRFRRSVKIAPGLKINFNKKSVSLTAGRRGAHVTKSFGGRSNYSVGVPGTGLWYRGYTERGRKGARGRAAAKLSVRRSRPRLKEPSGPRSATSLCGWAASSGSCRSPSSSR